VALAIPGEAKPIGANHGTTVYGDPIPQAHSITEDNLGKDPATRTDLDTGPDGYVCV
jgi:hypothetical protein